MSTLTKLPKASNVIYKIKKEKNPTFCHPKSAHDQYGKTVGLGPGKEFTSTCYDPGNVYPTSPLAIEEFFEGLNWA